MTPSSGREHVPRATQAFDELRASGKSSEDIFITLYADLKQLARTKVARQPAGASMHATRLLSDLYLRLFGKDCQEFRWESSRHFFNTMALAMEQLLIDHARRLGRRGRGRVASLDAMAESRLEAAYGPVSHAIGKNLSQENVERAVFIKELLDRLENEHAGEDKARIARRQAEIVRFRLLLGLAENEIAAILDCSSETVTKEFRKAKAKLASYARLDLEMPETSARLQRRVQPN